MKWGKRHISICVCIFIVLLSSLLLPSLLNERVAKDILIWKMDKLEIMALKRDQLIKHTMIQDIADLKFDCGKDDIETLRNLNLYNSQFRVQGIKLAKGSGCSSLGPDLDIISRSRMQQSMYKLDNYNIGITSTAQSYGVHGEQVIFANINGNYVYWVLNGAWTYEQLQTPCKDCFYMEYHPKSLQYKSLSFSTGNYNILMQPEEQQLSVAREYNGMIYKLYAGQELMDYTYTKIQNIVYLFIAIVLGLMGFFYAIIFNYQKSLSGLLHTGLKRREFVPFYQPVVDASTDKVVGFEALLRWQHKGDTICPSTFIDYAEKKGIILPITEQLMERVIDDLKNIPDTLWVSINVVPEQIENGSLYKMLAKNRWPYSNRLCFEITERIKVDDFETAAREIAKIKLFGYRFKLDDFGTGYGGFSYIQKLGVDEIKIDKMFVDTIGVDDLKRDVLDSIIAFSKESHMDVIAEGVETKTQLTYLLARGIHLIQGFIYAKPLSFEHLKVWLTEPRQH